MNQYGSSIHDVAKAFSTLGRAMGKAFEDFDFFEVEHRDDERGPYYLITYYNTESMNDIHRWFKARKVKPKTLNGYGYFVETRDADLATLAKLTWGGN
jgi:hypothetical protein